MSDEPFPYTIQGKLGQGGMGQVFRAWDPHTQRHVALKRITTASHPTHLERFLREGELTARLDHPGIVKVHHTGQHQGAPYIAYELVEGCQPLDHAFRTRDLSGRLDLVAQAAEALGHAHAHGVIHRDVKPENLLVDREGRVKVADFGLATAADLERLTRTGTTMGTPFYMAPELVTGDRGEVGPWTDVWALGVILYQALTDALPFEGQSMIELAAQIISNTPHRPSSRSSERLPMDLERICLRAIEKAPARRYPRGEDLARDLRAFLHGEPIGRRRPRWVLALGVLAGAAWVTVASFSPAPPKPPPPLDPPPAPVPVQAPSRPVADPATIDGYRRLRSWLRDPAHATHPDAAAVRAELERACARPLLELAVLDPPDLEAHLKVRVWNDETVLLYVHKQDAAWRWSLGAPPEPIWTRRRLRIHDAEINRAADGTPRSLWVARGHLAHRHPGPDPFTDSGELVWRAPRQDDEVISALHVNSDESRWAVGGEWGTFWVGGAGGDPVALELPNAKLEDLQFSPDGTQLLIAAGGPFSLQSRYMDQVTLYDAVTPALRWRQEWATRWTCVEPLGPGTWLAGTAGGEVAVLTEAQEFAYLHDPEIPYDPMLGYPHAHTDVVTDLAATRSRTYAASVSGTHREVRNTLAIWRLDARAPAAIHTLPQASYSLDVTPDDALWIVGLRGGSLQVWGVPPEPSDE